MGTWIGAWAETRGRTDLGSSDRDPRDLADLLAAHHIELQREPDGAWLYIQAEVSLASLVPPAFARALSAELGGRVVAFLLQSTSSVEEIECFDRGEPVRTLRYSAEEGGWLTVEGRPQDWESTYFFEHGDGTADGERWPLNLNDEISDQDIARYEAARSAGTAEDILDLLHAGSGWGLRRVSAELGLAPDAPHALYRPPANRQLRWKLYAGGAALLAFFAFMFWLGRG